MVQPTKQAPRLFYPRGWQRQYFIDKKRRNIEVVHRRGGKSVKGINDIIDEASRFNKMDPLTGRPLMNPQYAYVATTIGQVEKIAWTYLKYYLQHMPVVKFNNRKLEATYPHPERGFVKIFLFGAENYDAHRGIYLDGYVLDEYGNMHPDVRDKVFLPTISDRKGWESIIGTPNGDNQFKKLYNLALDYPDKWHVNLLKASESGIIDEEELAELRLSMSDEAYMQEYECDFNIAPEGYYYVRYMDDAERSGRITSVPHDPMYPVNTYWDLGVNDTCAIWFFQEVGREIRVINYMEGHGRGLDYWAPEVMKMSYRYNRHFLPHDVMAREITTAVTRLNFLELQGLKNISVIPKCADVNEGIHAVRQVLPLCIFDSNNCKTGIMAMREYQKKYDSKNFQYLNSPLHNWASNGADSFRGFAVSYQKGFASEGDLSEYERDDIVESKWDPHSRNF